jgi:hypothetical protein
MPPSHEASKQVLHKKSAAERGNSGLTVAKQIIVPAVLLCVAFAIYTSSLKFGFILDDHRFTSDPRIQEAGHLVDYFSNYVWAQFTGGPPSFYRPVFVVWMRLSYLLAELSSWGWHFLSIAKHGLVGIVLFVLIYRLLRDRYAAFVAALLFVLHPSHTESVSWVTVPDPLLTLFLLLSLLSYLRYLDGLTSGIERPVKRSRKVAERRTRASSGIWLIASCAAYFAALLVKETAIVFPAVILVSALSAQDIAFNEVSRSEKAVADARRQTLSQLVMFALATAVYLLLRWNALDGKLASATQHLPWKTVVLSWPATLWFYVKVVIWPVKPYAFADPNLIASFSVRGVLLPLLELICCFGILVSILIWVWRTAGKQLTHREASRMRFGLIAGTLLLLLPLLLTLNLNALNPGDFLHGRYVYLPLAGLSILVAPALHLATKLRPILLWTTALVALAFVPFTWSQEKQWKDDATVFTVAHQLAPNNRPVARNLADTRVRAALLIADEGRCDEAMPVFDEVNREFPDDWYTWAGRGICFVHANDLVRAEEALHRAADLSHDPRVVQQWQALRAHLGLPNSAPTN